MLYYDKIDVSEGNILLKVIEEKNCLFPTIVFVIMDSNFKINYALVVMI